MKIDIYCDESKIELLHARKEGYLVIGSLWIDRENRDIFKNKIEELKKKHSFNVEIKWTKISYKKLEFYKELFDIFLEFAHFNFFRAIVIPTEKVNLAKFHHDNADIGFYGFYNQLLKHHINSYRNRDNHFFIYVDHKTNKVHKPLSKLKTKLQQRSKYGIINLVEPIHSHENLFIQWVDVFTGLVSYSFNETPKGVKKEFIDYAESKLGYKLNEGTSKNEELFNIFKMDLY